MRLLLLLLLLAALPAHAQERGWPAKYQNNIGTACCTIGQKDDDHNWDCTAVPASRAMGLGIGSRITIDLPNGPKEVTINSMHPSETPDFIICGTGCLFTAAGV